jgi:hypothetical protein
MTHPGNEELMKPGGPAHHLCLMLQCLRRSGLFLAGFTLFALSAFCQTPAADPNTGAAPQNDSKRLFGLIPNYRSSPPITSYKPLSSKEKFTIGLHDSFDRGAIILALAFAGKGQLMNATPSFGQCAAGYAKYFGAGYSDVILGDMMTEAIYPSLLHQDPRYFRKGAGSGWSRLGYAMGQIFVTHKDSGGRQINYSELVGSATGVAISNAYYPDTREVLSNVSKLNVQIGIDMAGNVMNEFWPDIMRGLSRPHKNKTPAATSSPH